HRLVFGEWATVSMLIKGASADVTWGQKLAQNLTGFYGANLLSVLVFAAFWALASLAALVSRREPGERLRHVAALQAPALFVLFHLAANSTIAYWYFVPAVLPHAAYLLR